MAKIQVWRSNVVAARDRASMTAAEAAVVDEALRAAALVKNDNINLDVETLPVAFARSLLEDPKLKPNQRAVLTLRLHGMRSGELDAPAAYGLSCATPLDFGSTLNALSRSQPNAELYWNGRWYPVVVRAELREDADKLAKNVLAEVQVGLGSATHTLYRPVGPAIFADDGGSPVERTVLEVLERLGFRRLQTPPQAFNLRLVASERAGGDHGRQVWVAGSVLQVQSRFWFGAGLNERPLGTPELPRRAVVEPSLDTEDGERQFYMGGRTSGFGESVSRLPLVRVFSLDLKDYAYVDVDDLRDYEYDEAALGRLYLPAEMKSVLRRVFETPADELFGDLIRGKHGGIVILACGRPGVGKTLTAEVYAEMARRPLYVLEFGELGTTVEQIERNLSSVFARVVRWRAVLQFDECEVFLSHRGDDLERSAIVGIFLRMLDYYEGLLFLTTNRPAALDEAIRSRVMLRLDYPDLDASARASVWRTMFDAASLELIADDGEPGDFAALAANDVNGRQIRNLVRLARILHPERRVTRGQVEALLRYGCR